MKIRTKVSVVVSLVLGICGAQVAQAEETTPEKKPVRAVWVMPMEGQAPWLDTQKVDVTFAEPELLAMGKTLVLLKHADGQMYAADPSLKLLGRVQLPENTSWIAIDDEARLLVHDGMRLWVAQTWEDAAQTTGFTPVLDIPNAKAIDGAGGKLAFADATHLSIVDLTTGAMHRIAAADFFDDAKCAAMTPEAVQKAAEEAAKKKKKTSKTKTQEPETSASTQVADVTNIWWRADGTGIVRLRSLLNVRTFITRDGGKSWSNMADAPRNLVHSHGWIWDGTDRVLSADGMQWVQVCGPKISVMDRLKPSAQLTWAASLPEGWTHLPSPVVPAVPEVSGTPLQNSEDAAGSQPILPSAPVCVDVAMIPTTSVAEKTQSSETTWTLYAPSMENTGLQVGLYSNAVCTDMGEEGCKGEIAKPDAWQVLPGKGMEPMILPESCLPVYLGNLRGLGVLMCQAPAETLTVYVRTADTDWTAETVLPEDFGRNTQLLGAEDGTLIITGACADETSEIEVPGMADGSDEVPLPTTIQRTVQVCATAVRLPEPVAQPDIWRIERVENVHGYVPLNGGRLLTIEAPEPAQRQLVLRATDRTQALIDHFDPSPWQGLVMTGEGCLALYDGSVAPEVLRSAVSPAVDPETGVAVEPMPVKLLSVEGKLADFDCATSRSLAELPVDGENVDEAKGDDHYGLRAGAGGFFTMNDVQTWFARVEALIPLYNGNYEIGLMYRLSGGNAPTAFGHLGLVSIRWRYDNFELFDFAVGAGLGYGNLCGYDKSADPGAMDENDETQPSGFSKCGNHSFRYLISGIATYKITPKWKIYVGAELIGGSDWGFDISGGLEVRF